MDTPGLVDAADDLYGRSPREFIAVRNQKVAAARAAGERDLATAIARLAKPSAAAWVVNMLVRHRTEEVGQALALGASLREAQQDLDRDALRQLGQRRRELTTALAQHGAEIAAESNQHVSPTVLSEVEQTVQAAMADAGAAAALASGRLLRSLSTVGVEVDLSEAVAVPESPGRISATSATASAGIPKTGAKTKPTTAANATAGENRERARAKRAVQNAQRAVQNTQREAQDSATALEQADQRIWELNQQRERLTTQLEELEARLADAQASAAAVDQETRRRQRERDAAARAAATAQRRVDQARQRLEQLLP